MKKNILLLTILLIFSLSSCSNGNWGEIIKSEDKLEQSQKQENTVIYTSFYPIYFLVKSLVGDSINVVNLVPAGGEPHEYEPTLKQISQMGKARLIVLSGLGLESYEKKLQENIKNVPIVMLSEELKNPIKLDKNEKEKQSDEHEHGNIDPHTWLSPKQYREMADILVIELEKKGFTNLDKSILQKLDDLNKNYVDGLKNCKQKQLVTSHEAFGYLARDYGLTQHAVFGISPEEEPSSKDIAGVIDLIKELKLKYIFSEEFVSPKFTDTIKKETGVSILSLHPLETLSSDEESKNEDYLTIMEKNLGFLEIGLECK